MRLSAKAILNWANVNDFEYASQWIVRAGDPLSLYFQLVDLDKSPIKSVPTQYFRGGNTSSPALRYLAGIGSNNQPVQVIVTFPSIDDRKVITLIATQPDSNDSSIWMVSVPASMQPGTGNVLFSVAEGNATRTFTVLQMIAVEYPGSDGCDGTNPNGVSNVFPATL